MTKTLFDSGLDSGLIDYEAAKEIASGDDVVARRGLAERTDAHPEILYFLAEDSKPEVRQAIAVNPHTPIQADAMLARDADDGVRCDLAGKIARLAPDLGDAAQDKVRETTIDILEILARDQLDRVRRILAEALKDVSHAPPELIERVIKRLARDQVIEVAGPVLEHSPLLTDEDLLEIIASDPVQGALAAIASRHGVAGPVCDAVVGGALLIDDTGGGGTGGGDAGAVAALLANPLAQIREETLDRILDAAPAQESWHAPLVRRPKLSARIARHVAAFVTASLLKMLQARDDLGPATTRAVAEIVADRLRAEDAAEDAPEAEDEAGGPATAIERARKLHAEDKLDQDTLSEALLAGRRSLASAGLAVLAGLPETVVAHIVESKSAKALTALAWKAGCDMEFAAQLQIRLGGIAPNATISPGKGGAYPMSEKDMIWQLEFFGV